jgi:acyl carrier protein
MTQDARSLDRAALVDLLVSGLRDILASSDRGAPSSLDERTALLGDGACLDSIGLVTLIVEIEQRLDEQFGVSIVLADERAMSQTRSPFQSIGTLADYVLLAVGRDGARP